MIFEEQVSRKPDHYPWAQEFIEAMHNGFWPDKEFRSQAIAIWFQMQEVVFKSLYYEQEEDKDGTKMTEYEDIGEQLKWNRDDRSISPNVSNSHSDCSGDGS